MNGQFYYTYKDYLGSLLAVTDSDGNVVGEQSFDAWGRYRDTETWVHTAGPGQGWPEWLTRGYTGHEHLPQFELVNMNGRMYDPKQARMLAVDNFVHDPYSTQGYNRYSYVLNNPLAYTDPSGENPIGALIGIAVGAVFNYLANAYNNNSWNPAQWTSGSITIGYSNNAGTGSSITTGGSVGNGPSFIAGMNVSTGNLGGGSSAYGMPSYSEVPGGSIPGINWGGVDFYRGFDELEAIPEAEPALYASTNNEIISNGGELALLHLVNHYIFGGGERYNLSTSAFNSFIVEMVREHRIDLAAMKPLPLAAGSKGLYLLNVSAYGTRYENEVGTGTIYINANGFVGYSDQWNFEAQQGGQRPKSGEFKTWVGSKLPGVPFWVEYGIIPPILYRPTN